MKPRIPPPEQDDLLRARLVEMIDRRHELVKLADLIDWEVFEREWAGLFPSSSGRPGTPTRLVANIAHPTDARLYEIARRKLVGLAREAGIGLRQNDNRLGPRLCGQDGRYAHARQLKRMRKALRRLKGYTGRVLRDIERQMDKVAEGPLKSRLQELVALANRLLAQKPKDRRKLYSLHESAVDCIRCPAVDARHRREGQKARRTNATRSARRSASPPPPKAASSSACGHCRATLMTATPCTRRWRRWKS